jgi:ribonuclease D
MSGACIADPIQPDGVQSSYAYHLQGMVEADSCEELSDWSDHSEWSAGFTSLPEEPGNIVVVNSLSSGACESLCNDATSADLVALDAEWAPDLERGSNNPISILQFAFPQSRRVYVVQLERIGGKLPPAVQMMLVNPQITKVGFGLDGSDVAKLALTGIAVTRCSMVDIQDVCAAALGCPNKTVGLMYAARELLGFAMDKDKQLVCSNWSSFQLTPAQIRYAALDAWVTLRLYYGVGH